MIDYSKVKCGDILRLVGQGAIGYAAIDDLLRVTKINTNGVFVENRSGEVCEFVFNCGAARLEPTEWMEDFPSDSHDGDINKESKEHPQLSIPA